MRPPICGICEKRMEMDEGGLVYFKKRESDIAWEKKMEETHGIGHPPYAEWFCGEHFDKARALSELTRDEAMARLKELFG